MSDVEKKLEDVPPEIKLYIEKQKTPSFFSMVYNLLLTVLLWLVLVLSMRNQIVLEQHLENWEVLSGKMSQVIVERAGADGLWWINHGHIVLIIVVMAVFFFKLGVGLYWRKQLEKKISVEEGRKKNVGDEK